MGITPFFWGEVLSKELNVLLQRIQPPEVKPIEGPVPASPELSKLLNRMEARKWRKWKQSEVLASLQQLYSELKFTNHAMKCEQCLLELCLDVTRYEGAHSPWYLNLQGEIGWYPDVYEEDSLYKTAPRIDKYNWGSYWKGGIDHEVAIRFIKDRMKWAKPIMQKEAEAAVDFYIALENWDLESPVPVDEATLIF